MKRTDVYVSNSPFEPAENHQGKRYKGKIVGCEDCSFEKPDGTTDPALGIEVSHNDLPKLVKVNNKCWRMLDATWGTDDTDQWIGKDVVVTTTFYDTFGKWGWIVDPDYDKLEAAEAQKQDQAQQALDDEQLSALDKAMGK